MASRVVRRWTKLVLLGFGLALGSAGAEGLLRAYGRLGGAGGRLLVNLDPLDAEILPMGQLGYRQRPNARLRYDNGTVATSNALGYRGPVVQVPKPSGTTRIVLVGGSTTHGWWVNDNQTIDAYLREELHQRIPKEPIEVVNLAYDGYDSYQLFERLRTDGARLDPDIIVVNAGINDVRNARLPDLQDRDPRTILWASVLERLRAEEQGDGPSPWTRAKHYSYLARFPGFLRLLQWRKREGSASRPAAPGPAAADYFERNMRRIAGLARNLGSSLLLSTPPSSLRHRYRPHDTSPNGYWLADAQATQAYRDTLAARMRAVAESIAATGYPVSYLHADLPAGVFIDDCHLLPEGNRLMALAIADALGPWLRDPGRSDAQSGSPPLRRGPRSRGE